MNAEDHTFDYVVVGGGTAGCVVAARLAEDEQSSVCLVEAGPPDDDNPAVLDLPRWSELIHSPLDYDYEIEPQARANSRIRHSRGRVLGGSSSHNGCAAWRAPERDMEAWEKAGAVGWGPAGVREHFDAVLRQTGLETTEPGSDLAAAFIAACERAGFQRRKFEADGNREGVGWLPVNKRGIRRRSSSVAYLHPLASLPENLTLLTDAQAYRIVFDEFRNAAAVVTARGLVRSREEIVVCCGAFDSAKLLLLSGIGPRDHLDDVGIPVVADLPVGQHLIDHPEGVLIFELARTIENPSAIGVDAVLLASVEFELNDGTDALNIMIWPFEGHFDAFTLQEQRVDHRPDVMSFGIDVLYPRSEGHVRLRSSDPHDPPLIDLKYFSDPDGHDEQVLVAGMRLMRSVVARQPLAAWLGRELAPGRDVIDSVELGAHARETVYTAYHPAGTCRMGAADEANTVVDPELRMKGVGRLRVADASIFPQMIGVNPCITCMMVGEKCAAMIRASAVKG